MAAVAVEIQKRPDWRGLDAVLFPAGYFCGGLGFEGTTLTLSDVGEIEFDPFPISRIAARRLQMNSPGCKVIVGADFPHGDFLQKRRSLMLAFDENGVVGVGTERSSARQTSTPEFVADRLRSIRLGLKAEASLWIGDIAWAASAERSHYSIALVGTHHVKDVDPRAALQAPVTPSRRRARAAIIASYVALPSDVHSPSLKLSKTSQLNSAMGCEGATQPRDTFKLRLTRGSRIAAFVQLLETV